MRGSGNNTSLKIRLQIEKRVSPDGRTIALRTIKEMRPNETLPPLRVLAKAEQLDEPKSAELARTIAKEIENELNYPGEVKVTLIRESRFIEYAR